MAAKINGYFIISNTKYAADDKAMDDT